MARSAFIGRFALMRSHIITLLLLCLTVGHMQIFLGLQQTSDQIMCSILREVLLQILVKFNLAALKCSQLDLGCFETRL